MSGGSATLLYGRRLKGEVFELLGEGHLGLGEPAARWRRHGGQRVAGGGAVVVALWNVAAVGR